MLVPLSYLVTYHPCQELKSATSYDNRLCTAYLNAGRGEEYLGLLESTCQGMSGQPDPGYVFPAGGFFGMLRGLPDLYPRCEC